MSDAFLFRFKPIFDMWGRDSFPDVYLERAEVRTSDLSPEEFKELCNLLIENCERAPSLVKIVGFASMIRGRREKRLHDFSNASVNCTECDDLGVVRVTKGTSELLMRCLNLKCQPSYYWELPRWYSGLEKEFTKSKCPLKWFKGDSIDATVIEWRALIRISTQKFTDLGFDIETNSDPDGAA